MFALDCHDQCAIIGDIFHRRVLRAAITKAVRVVFGDGSAQDATVKDVADDGALIVTVKGKQLHVTAGEVRLRASSVKK